MHPAIDPSREAAMADQKNPYAAPSAPVADVHAAQDRGEFIKDGQSVPAGQGWHWWREGAAIFRASPWMWVLLVVVLIGVFAAAAAIAGVIVGASMTRGNVAAFILVFALFGLATSIVYPVFLGGMMLGARAVEDGEGLTVGHLFAGFAHSGGALAAVGLLLLAGNIVIQLVVTLLFGIGFSAGMAGSPTAVAQQGALVFLVYLALTVPLAMGFWFAPALVVFHGLSAVEAIRCSFIGCLKNIVPFLIYGLVGLALGILIALVLGVLVALTRGLGIIVVLAFVVSIGPIVLGSIYAAYRDIYTLG
jgi:hypothetical protein